MIATTEQRIHEWALWSRAGGPVRALGYKSPSLALMRQHMGSTVRSAALCDEEAMFIDAVVTRLRARRGDLWLALALYYGVTENGRCCGSYRATAEKLGTNKTHAAQLVQIAVAWIDGQFDGVECMFDREAA